MVAYTELFIPSGSWSRTGYTTAYTLGSSFIVAQTISISQFGAVLFYEGSTGTVGPMELWKLSATRKFDTLVYTATPDRLAPSGPDLKYYVDCDIDLPPANYMIVCYKTGIDMQMKETALSSAYSDAYVAGLNDSNYAFSKTGITPITVGQSITTTMKHFRIFIDYTPATMGTPVTIDCTGIVASTTSTAYSPTVTTTNGVVNATITAGLGTVTTTAKAPTASGAITVVVETSYANGQVISLQPITSACAETTAIVSTVSSSTYSPTVSGAITVFLVSPYIDVGISATTPTLSGLANVVVDDIGSMANAMPVTPSTTQTVNLAVTFASIGGSAIEASLGGIVNRTVLVTKSTLTTIAKLIQVSTQQCLTSDYSTAFVDTVAPTVISNALVIVDDATTYMMAFSPGVGMHQGVTIQTNVCNVDIDSVEPTITGSADVNIHNADAYSVAFAPNLGIKQGVTIQSVYSTASTQAKSPWVVLTKEIMPSVATISTVGIGSKIVSSNNLQVSPFSNWIWANMPMVVIHLYYLRLYGQINKMIAIQGDITSMQTLSGDVNIQVTKKGQW